MVYTTYHRDVSICDALNNWQKGSDNYFFDYSSIFEGE